MEDSRRGNYDKQVLSIAFRTPFVKEKGLLKVLNDFNQILANRITIIPAEYTQIGWDTVGVMVNAISDMMQLKDFAKRQKAVLMVGSGSERLMGQYVTEKEKQRYYKKAKLNAEKKRKQAEDAAKQKVDEEFYKIEQQNKKKNQ